MIVLTLDIGVNTGSAIVKKNSDSFFEVLDVFTWDIQKWDPAYLLHHLHAMRRSFLLTQIVVEFPLVDLAQRDSPLVLAHNTFSAFIHDALIPWISVKPGVWKTTPYARQDILKYQTREKWLQFKPNAHEKDALGIANWFLSYGYKKLEPSS